jgi:hypothetical protein
MLLRTKQYPKTFFRSLAFHRSLSCVKIASPRRTRIPQHLARPRHQTRYSLLIHDEKMMEADEEQSPNSGSADSSWSESPANASTPPPMIDVTETVTIIPTDRTIIGTKNAASKSKDASPVPEIISPRAYQREMLEQSLKRNVIVAVSTFEHRLFETYRLTAFRWTQAAERPKCMFIAECSGSETLTETLQRCSSHSSGTREKLT